MQNTSREEVERQGREWRLERLAIEARKTEASGRQLEPGVTRFQVRLQEIGSDFGLFRR